MLRIVGTEKANGGPSRDVEKGEMSGTADTTDLKRTVSKVSVGMGAAAASSKVRLALILFTCFIKLSSGCLEPMTAQSHYQSA